MQFQNMDVATLKVHFIDSYICIWWGGGSQGEELESATDYVFRF